jgi:hypothetical protein
MLRSQGRRVWDDFRRSGVIDLLLNNRGKPNLRRLIKIYSNKVQVRCPAGMKGWSGLNCYSASALNSPG